MIAQLPIPRAWQVDALRALAASTWAGGSPWFSHRLVDAKFRPLPITATHPLDDGVAAYQAVADQIAGRVVIRP